MAEDITVPQQLPLFEGQRPNGSGVRLTGKVTTPFRALGLLASRLGKVRPSALLRRPA